jgi:RNA ligase (TIGR02306 family)
MSRKLVTLRKVSAIIPIDKCDNIALAIIDGWSVIVKKTEFQVGDQCLFFEIDSFIPASDTRFEFLKKTTTFEGKEGYRLKTMKMKGVISQGLALPLTMFPELTDYSDDYSDKLGVIKYDNAIQELDQRPGLKPGKPRESFPSFIPKTDQERIQNLTHLWKTLPPDTAFEETLKLDGSSMTCYKIDQTPTLWQRFKALFGFTAPNYHFGVCSRNLELSRSANNVITFDNQGKSSEYNQSDFWRTAISYDIESKLPTGYAVQGELLGPKIQANHEKVTKLEYHIFDVFDISTGLYLRPLERREFCAKHGLPHVPITDTMFQPFQYTLQELLEHVDTESMNPNTISEGRVYKVIDGSNLSFKVINNKYLLKSEV